MASTWCKQTREFGAVFNTEDISNNVGPVKSFFERTSPFTPESGLRCSFAFCIDDHGSLIIFRSAQSDPNISSIKTSTMITSSNSPLQGSGMPNHRRDVLLHTMSSGELSRVRTELQRWRIRTSVPPHPVQANRQSASHRYLPNALVPTHRQMLVATPPIGVAARGDLRGLHQQTAQ